MAYTPGPFDNIESSKQYVHLLREAIEEARREVDEQIDLSKREKGSERLTEALQVVAHNLAKLSYHLKTSGRILNDLRTLRSLLLSERKVGSDDSEHSTVAADPEDHESDFTIKFAPGMSPTQVKLVLTALSDFYRACEGVGFKIRPELEEILVRARVPVNV